MHTVSFTQASAPWSAEQRQTEGGKRKLAQPEDQRSAGLLGDLSEPV